MFCGFAEKCYLCRDETAVDRHSHPVGIKLLHYGSRYAYNNLALQDSAIFIIENVFSNYVHYGYSIDAAIALGGIVRPLIDMGEYQKAKNYMDIYETKSGLFDADGNIAYGREIYYKVKGLYYLYNNKLDSAEYFFRKELHDGRDYNNQNAAAIGLAQLFQKQHRSDSASKYAIYAYAMIDSVYAQKTTQTVERMQSMYDYSRHQEEAYKEKEKAQQRTIIIWICIAIILFISLLTFTIIRELSRKRHDAEQRYLQAQSAIEQAQHDIANLRLSEDINKELISEKEQTIREQETIIKSLLHTDSSSQQLADRRLLESDICQRFDQLSTKGLQPSLDEWELIAQQLFRCYPGFKEFLSKHETIINDKEYKTCLLIRIGFKPANIGTMLEVSSSYITELRTKMLLKLFGLSGSSKTFDKMLRDIY